MGKKEKYQISSSVKDGILEMVLTGELAERDIGDLQDEVIGIILASNVKFFLVDVCAIKGRFGYFEAFKRVRSYPPEVLGVKTAIVDIPENDAYEHFHEITAQNAGLSYKCFTDIDAARAWLKSK
ncbi:MAG: hypothetical protein JW976_03480 [Syntrophaceae bacterium]|nr:hypothetical protein [Syntrophaceae bacterium]